MGNVKINERTAKLGDFNMFYLDTETDKQPIICIHGLYGRAGTWTDFMEKYGRDYRVIAMDLRGHGLSSKTKYGYFYNQMVEDVIDLMEYLKIGPAIIVGHSMGGAVAGYMAAMHKKYVKAAAILDKTAAMPSEEHRFPFGRNDIRDNFTADWHMPFKTREEAEKCIKENTESEFGFEYFVRSLYKDEDGYKMMFDPYAVAKLRSNMTEWFELLPSIECPVMLVRSSSHEAVNDADFARMKNEIKNCMAFEMTSPDHNVHVADKDEFYKYFNEFLSSIQ